MRLGATELMPYQFLWNMRVKKVSITWKSQKKT